MEYIIGILVISAIIIAVSSLGETKNTTETIKIDKLHELKTAYESALTGNNKRVALDAGRAYYSESRENKALTVYDEQAIANDLSTMTIQHEDHTTYKSFQIEES